MRRLSIKSALISATFAVVLFAACSSPTATPAILKPTLAPSPLPPTETPAPTGPVVTDGMLAPEGDPAITYYAPFPVAITLDGFLDDWQGVPTVSMPYGADPATVKAAITFAATADKETLYLMANVTDSKIIAGQHDDNYWNEDSVEFYLNGTGNLELGSYFEGVAQVTVPAVNIGRPSEEVVLAGINGTTVGATAIVVETETGYALEVAIPLKNNVWNIPLAHGSVIGFQVHLNAASEQNRDTKLIWSAFDKSDQSYQNPSLFGQLIFYEIGNTDLPIFQPTATAFPTATLQAVTEDVPYKNPNLSVEERVEDLLARMSLAEKLGQMTLVEKNSMPQQDVTDRFIGGVLSGGGGHPPVNTAEYWGRMITRFQKYALATRLGIPLIYGADGVHGHNNVRGAVIFPHNIGLGAANDEDLMRRIGEITASEMAATGIYWDYAPVVAVVQDIRWGRTYESYSENTDLVTKLALAYMEGLQGDDLTDPFTVLATFKHYVGDGGTVWGSSTTGNYQIDQGVADVDEATLRAIHLPPYVAGINSGARSIMVSYSSWGGLKMHAQKYLITDVLKGELGFDGFVVSDWAGVDQISTNYYDSVVAAINAGVDMNMVPYDYDRFLDTLASAVENGDISEERIEDAVRRILRVKFELGLFENAQPNLEALEQFGSEEHRAVAREAVSKSLVLLKNDNQALPLSKSTPLIYVAGLGANDIGMQSGGWTIEWQGKPGEITAGTTILQGINNTVSTTTQVEYDESGRFNGTADACVAVVGEPPYAEGIGDDGDLLLSSSDIQMTERMREQCNKLVVVLLSGRPLIITEQLPHWDAFVAAWLPGTEGEGVADVLFGDRPFTGKLSFTWPHSVDQLPFDFNNLGAGDNGPLFPFGFGLTK